MTALLLILMLVLGLHAVWFFGHYATFGIEPLFVNGNAPAAPDSLPVRFCEQAMGRPGEDHDRVGRRPGRRPHMGQKTSGKGCGFGVLRIEDGGRFAGPAY